MKKVEDEYKEINHKINSIKNTNSYHSDILRIGSEMNDILLKCEVLLIE